MSHGRKVGVVGLGYVGLPVAVAFAQGGGEVVAFDTDSERIEELGDGLDRTGECDGASLRSSRLRFTGDPADLSDVDFFIVTVPTPVTQANVPDLDPVIKASRTVAGFLKPGDIVVYESTFYPGLTEEICQPILEEVSGLKSPAQFAIGYSPERINPGDREHRFENITKIVSAQDEATLNIVAQVYGGAVPAGVHRAESIMIAEAAKVIENTQRDLNIALMNELSLICHRLGLDTHEVIKTAATKWNFVPYSPGLVGGHCIGVDPFYLTHRAEQAGYHPEVILSGRRINDDMGRYVARQVHDVLKADQGLAEPDIIVLGVTFKENVPDPRNSRVPEMVAELQALGANVQVHDPLAGAADMEQTAGFPLVEFEELRLADAVVLAVPHQAFIRDGWVFAESLLKKGKGLVADIKGVLEPTSAPAGVKLWRL